MIRSIKRKFNAESDALSVDPIRAELVTLNDSGEADEVRILFMSKSSPNRLETFEKPGGEGWLVNGDQHLLVQFKPECSLTHGHWVELRTYIWIRPQPPVPQSRRKLSNQIAGETWKNMVKVGWRRCAPPVR